MLESIPLSIAIIALAICAGLMLGSAVRQQGPLKLLLLMSVASWALIDSLASNQADPSQVLVVSVWFTTFLMILLSIAVVANGNWARVIWPKDDVRHSSQILSDLPVYLSAWMGMITQFQLGIRGIEQLASWAVLDWMLLFLILLGWGMTVILIRTERSIPRSPSDDPASGGKN